MNLRKKYIIKKNIKKWGYSELNRSMVPYFKGSLRFLLIIFIFSPGLLLPSASAHPELTNYVDTSATLKFNQNKVEVEYRVNLSELYAFSEIEKADIDGDLVLNSQESLKYGKFICAELRNNISIANNQLKVTLNLLSHSSVIDITKSEFGTLEIFCKFDGVLKLDSENKVEWSDENYPSPGYRELVVSPGIGVTTDKSYPEISPSRNLSNFSEIKLGEKDIRANFYLYYNAANGNEVKEDQQVEVSKPNSKLDADMVSNKSFGDLTKLYSKLFRVSDLNLTVVLLGFLFALFLGALHSFAPGHGKSTMLLLAVDKDIKRIELYKLAINMAISHTIGVITLGFILYFGFTQSSDLITIVLSIILSIFLIIFGAYVASKRFKDLSEDNGNSKSSHWHGGVAHSHYHEGKEEDHYHQDHADGHGHSHHHENQKEDHNHQDHADGHGHSHHHEGEEEDHTHQNHSEEHGHSHHHHGVDEGGNHEEHQIGKTKYMSKKNLRFLGLLGGLVPTPSALTLLIGSAALGNILYGVILVIAYGIGMGIVLIIGGYYLNKLFQGIESRRSKSTFYIKLSTYLPITTAIIQIISGVTLLIISIRFLI
jgi:ABC-type nickel/cobalt efflux system permease component RcnA